MEIADGADGRLKRRHAAWNTEKTPGVRWGSLEGSTTAAGTLSGRREGDRGFVYVSQVVEQWLQLDDSGKERRGWIEYHDDMRETDSKTWIEQIVNYLNQTFENSIGSNDKVLEFGAPNIWWTPKWIPGPYPSPACPGRHRIKQGHQPHLSYSHNVAQARQHYLPDCTPWWITVAQLFSNNKLFSLVGLFNAIHLVNKCHQLPEAKVKTTSRSFLSTE